MVQRTQRSDEAQHVDIGANRLLGLEGLAVELVELQACGDRVVHVATDEEAAAVCPSCGVVSTSMKGHAITRPRDIAYGEAAMHLVWHKRRWRCRETACGRASFTESVLQVPARSRLTTRLRRACGAGIAEEFKDVQTAGAYFGLSWPTAHAAFIAHTATALAAPLPAVSAGDR